MDIILYIQVPLVKVKIIPHIFLFLRFILVYIEAYNSLYILTFFLNYMWRLSPQKYIRKIKINYYINGIPRPQKLFLF